MSLPTDKPAVPTEPADDDVRIFEHCEVPGVVTGWEVSAKNGFPMKRYDIEEEAHKAAREFAKGHSRDIWVIRTGPPPRQPPQLLKRIDRPGNTEKPSILSAPSPVSKPSSGA